MGALIIKVVKLHAVTDIMFHGSKQHDLYYIRQMSNNIITVYTIRLWNGKLNSIRDESHIHVRDI